MPGDLRIIKDVMIRQSATYREIQNWVRKEHGFLPKTCWIAHCKEIHGLPLGKTPNRYGRALVEPCPAEKVDAIAKALRHFRMLPQPV